MDDNTLANRIDAVRAEQFALGGILQWVLRDAAMAGRNPDGFLKMVQASISKGFDKVSFADVALGDADVFKHGALSSLEMHVSCARRLCGLPGEGPKPDV
jgi:hypothetical protein